MTDAGNTTSTDNKAAELLDNDPRRGERVTTVCFIGGLSGFRELGDDALIVRRAPEEAYLIRTGFCPNLQYVEGLKINHADRRLRRGDRLLLFDTPFPRTDSSSDTPDCCLVTDIHHWNESASKERQD